VVNNRGSTMDYFEATSDTFGGNSGSGAFDACGTLVGILVRRAADYVTSGSCSIVNVVNCDSSGCTDNAESLSYPHNAMASSEVIDCHSNSDCGGSLNCHRQCPANDVSCTGWCTSSPLANIRTTRINDLPISVPLNHHCAASTICTNNPCQHG